MIKGGLVGIFYGLLILCNYLLGSSRMLKMLISGLVWFYYCEDYLLGDRGLFMVVVS